MIIKHTSIIDRPTDNSYFKNSFSDNRLLVYVIEFIVRLDSKLYNIESSKLALWIIGQKYRLNYRVALLMKIKHTTD